MLKRTWRKENCMISVYELRLLTIVTDVFFLWEYFLMKLKKKLQKNAKTPPEFYEFVSDRTKKNWNKNKILYRKKNTSLMILISIIRKPFSDIRFFPPHTRHLDRPS